MSTRFIVERAAITRIRGQRQSDKHRMVILLGAGLTQTLRRGLS
jgi:hypothetical protein